MSDAITSKDRQKELDRRQAGASLQFRNDLVNVLSTAEGRRVLWHVIDDLAGLHSYATVADNQTFISEGRRSVGGRLLLELQQASMELTVEMVTEAIRAGVAKQQLMQSGQAARKDD